jgi:hypothetical protein
LRTEAPRGGKARRAFGPRTVGASQTPIFFGDGPNEPTLGQRRQLQLPQPQPQPQPEPEPEPQPERQPQPPGSVLRINHIPPDSGTLDSGAITRVWGWATRKHRRTRA